MSRLTMKKLLLLSLFSSSAWGKVSCLQEDCGTILQTISGGSMFVLMLEIFGLIALVFYIAIKIHDKNK